MYDSFPDPPEDNGDDGDDNVTIVSDSEGTEAVIANDGSATVYFPDGQSLDYDPATGEMTFSNENESCSVVDIETGEEIANVGDFEINWDFGDDGGEDDDSGGDDNGGGGDDGGFVWDDSNFN